MIKKQDITENDKLIGPSQSLKNKIKKMLSFDENKPQKLFSSENEPKT